MKNKNLYKLLTTLASIGTLTTLTPSSAFDFKGIVPKDSVSAVPEGVENVYFGNQNTDLKVNTEWAIMENFFVDLSGKFLDVKSLGAPTTGKLYPAPTPLAGELNENSQIRLSLDYVGQLNQRLGDQANKHFSNLPSQIGKKIFPDTKGYLRTEDSGYLTKVPTLAEPDIVSVKGTGNGETAPTDAIKYSSKWLVLCKPDFDVKQTFEYHQAEKNGLYLEKQEDGGFVLKNSSAKPSDWTGTEQTSEENQIKFGNAGGRLNGLMPEDLNNALQGQLKNSLEYKTKWLAQCHVDNLVTVYKQKGENNTDEYFLMRYNKKGVEYAKVTVAGKEATVAWDADIKKATKITTDIWNVIKPRGAAGIDSYLVNATPMKFRMRSSYGRLIFFNFVPGALAIGAVGGGISYGLYKAMAGSAKPNGTTTTKATQTNAAF